MSSGYVPSVQTVAVFAVFVPAYLYLLARRTLSRDIDLHDLLLLSTVALVPGAMVFFPRLADLVARLLGVEFPFVGLFGGLFLVCFVMLHRLTVKLYILQSQNRMLIQELGRLKSDFERVNRG